VIGPYFKVLSQDLTVGCGGNNEEFFRFELPPGRESNKRSPEYVAALVTIITLLPLTPHFVY